MDMYCVRQTALGRSPEGCPYVDICGDIAPTIPDGVVDARDVGAMLPLVQGTPCLNCENAIQDLEETDVDCGGTFCGACPTCSDALLSPTLGETDVDCGGETCDARCGPGQECGASADCVGGYQCMVGECTEHHCTNGVRDADETEVDCGGIECSACQPTGPTCEIHTANTVPESVFGVVVDVAGSDIVWTDRRNGNSEIYTYNVDTGAERRLTNNPAEDRAPSVDNRKMVYHVESTGPNQPAYLYLMDLAQAVPTRQLITSKPYVAFADINGDQIVWEQFDTTRKTQIYKKRLSESTPTLLHTFADDNSPNLDVQGTQVTYGEGVTNHEVYRKGISGGTPTHISASPVAMGNTKMNRDLYGSTVVWTSGTNGAYQISKGTSTTDNQVLIADGQMPEFDSTGTKIAYVKNNNQVYVYDLGSQQSIWIDDSATEKLGVAIGTDLVTWISGQNVYYTDLSTCV